MLPAATVKEPLQPYWVGKRNKEFGLQPKVDNYQFLIYIIFSFLGHKTHIHSLVSARVFGAPVC